MAQERTYEVIQEIESAALPPLAPIQVGDPLTGKDAINLDFFTNAGYDARASLSPVANLAALKAISTTTRIDGSLAIRLDTKQLYEYSQTSTETSNDRNVVTPNDSTGRWIEVRRRAYARTVSENYTIKSEDETILCDSLASDITLTTPSHDQGVSYNIIKLDASAYKVTVAGFELKYQNQSVTILSDGTNWRVLNEYLPLVPNERFSNLGSSTVDGSWQTIVSGTSLLFQRRESGVWVTKHEMEA